MKKSIVLPIIAALMSVVVAVGVALMVQDITNSKIWHKVTAIRGMFYNGELAEENTFYVVHSKEELILLYNAYGRELDLDNHDWSSCNSYMHLQIKGYDDKFFEKKSLIIAEKYIPASDLLSLKSIYFKNNILIVEFYQVEIPSFAIFLHNTSIFVEVKKSDIQGMTDKQLNIIAVKESDVDSNRKYHVPKGLEESYPNYCK